MLTHTSLKAFSVKQDPTEQQNVLCGCTVSLMSCGWLDCLEKTEISGVKSRFPSGIFHVFADPDSVSNMKQKNDLVIQVSQIVQQLKIKSADFGNLLRHLTI